MKKIIFAISISIFAITAFAQETIVDNSTTTIKCETDQLYKIVDRENNVEEAVDVLHCSFREEWEYAYGANFLQVTAHTAEFASSQIQSACKKKGLSFGRYIRNVVKGGIENFKVENKETQVGVVAKITGGFYCTPDDLGLYKK